MKIKQTNIESFPIEIFQDKKYPNYGINVSTCSMTETTCMLEKA